MTCPVHNWPLKDKRGCWKCIDEERMEDKQVARESIAKKVYQIPKQSLKKKESEKELAKLRKVVKAGGCQSCNNPEGPIDYSHILSVAQYPEFETHPDNGIGECRKCHLIWENSPLEEKMKLKSWPLKLKVILKLKPSHFNKMQLKKNEGHPWETQQAVLNEFEELRNRMQK